MQGKMENYSFVDLANIVIVSGMLFFLCIVILSFLRSVFRKLFPNVRLTERGLIAVIAAWCSGLNFEVQQILQWMAVIIGFLWLIAATLVFGSLEVLFFLNPDAVSGNLFPPENLLMDFGWFGILFFLSGIIACGRTEFDEGSTVKLLYFLKAASLYICICLSIAGFIFLIAAVALGRGPAVLSSGVLLLTAAGSGLYMAHKKSESTRVAY
jgi:hypothetical protein